MSQTEKRKVVVITGASAGVGRATVRRFAGDGAAVGLLARGTEALDNAQQEVERSGGRAIALPTDVSDADQVEKAAETVENEFGPIDVWVNNAMVSVFSPVKEMTPEDFKRVMEVCFLGFVHGTVSALHRMLPRDRGVIIQVGSALAYRGIPLQSAYCAAKHAIQGFNDSLRAELIHDKSNVKLSMIQMPALNTPQFGWVKSRLPNKPQPVPPIYQPEVAAEAIHYVAHHPRREMYVGGMNTAIIYGNKFFPGIGDRYLAKNGYEAQFTDEPAEPDREHNLYHPISGDHGAHGTFGDKAKTSSWQLWLNKNRGWVVLTTIGLLAILIAAFFPLVD